MNILIAMVHNKDDFKVSYIREKLNKMVDSLNRNGFNAVVREFSYQPVITGHSYFKYLRRCFIYEVLNYRWIRYRKLSYNLKSFIGSLITLFSKSVKGFSTDKKLKFSEIETFVTDKHLRAWFSALEGFDAVLVFEDDVFFNFDSINRFNFLINSIDLKEKCYFDLAGGLDKELLNIYQLLDLENSPDGLLCYKKIVTNTACAYLITKPLLQDFCDLIVSNPSNRIIGIDWLINYLSICLEGTNVKNLKCYHSEPPIFQHGSFTGKYESWQKKD